MMSGVAVAGVEVDGPAALKRRLEAFAGEVLAGAMNRPVQVANGGVYLRGLLEEGPRKSLEPMCERLGDEADYQSLQQFLADSPWEPELVVRAVAERVAPVIDVEAWVLDDTGFPKDGKRSPGVKRQYSGTLGKIGNCQIGVSVHAVGAKGTVPLGWALYLPEEWCEDPERRRKAKICAEVEFKTKPELGVELVESAAAWKIAQAPVLETKPTAITPRCVSVCTTSSASTCCPWAPKRRSLRPARRLRCPSGKAAQAARPAGRAPTAIPRRSVR